MNHTTILCLIVLVATTLIALFIVSSSKKESEVSLREFRASCNKIGNYMESLEKTVADLEAENERLTNINHKYRTRLKELGDL